MINRVRSRQGGYKYGVSNTVKYQLKLKPTEDDDSFDSSIPRIEGESDWQYAMRVERVFEAARVPNQKQLYQHNTLSFHPDESKNLSNKQIMEIAKEFYLKEGLGDKNRHYVFTVERDTAHAHVHAAIHLTDLESKRVNNKMVNYNPIATRLEKKYGLYQVDRSPNPFNDNEPKKDKKKEFKDDLNSLMKTTSTASGFLVAADAAGYEIIHNGNSAFSFQKDGETFKASDLGMSYKSLKARFGDDSGFPATLARLNRKPRESGPVGSLSGPQFQSAQDYDKKQKKNRVLDLSFSTTDGQSYKWNGSNREAFNYKNGVATFYNSSPTAIKAGLQRLEETTKNPKDKELAVNGSHDFKRKTWLEFHKMGLDKKGFSLKGYSPSATDKAELERIKNQAKDKYTKAKDEIQKNEIKEKIEFAKEGLSKDGLSKDAKVNVSPEASDNGTTGSGVKDQKAEEQKTKELEQNKDKNKKQEQAGDVAGKHKIDGAPVSMSQLKEAGEAALSAKIREAGMSSKYASLIEKGADVQAAKNIAETQKNNAENEAHQEEREAEKAKHKRRMKLKPQ
ncbi:relaxase/mobilization nuclease domain-containing protein [Pseudomonas aeruginosa]